MKLNKLFDVIYGNKLDFNKMAILPISKGGINFVGRSSKNHGVSGTVAPLPGIEPYEAGLLTVALGGTKLLSSFVQEQPFYTAQNVAILKPKRKMTFAEKLFVCICIRHNRFRYSAFGREANKTLGEMLLPDLSEFPGWINNYSVEGIEDKYKAANQQSHIELNVKTWKYFMYKDLFNIERGRGPRRKDIVTGMGITPFITSIDNKNGLAGYVTMPPCHDGNTITVNRNGSVGEAFYQPYPFCSTEDVHVFKPKFLLNPFHALFLITLIRKEQYRYCYGRKWGLDRMKRTLIKLPVDAQGKPDWGFMEEYIKTLPFSSQV